MSKKQSSNELRTIVDKWLKTRNYPIITPKSVARIVLNLEPHQIDQVTISNISLALYELGYKRGLKKRFSYCPYQHPKS